MSNALYYQCNIKMVLMSLGGRNFQLHYNFMGSPFYMWSVVNRNGVMWRMIVIIIFTYMIVTKK